MGIDQNKFVKFKKLSRKVVGPQLGIGKLLRCAHCKRHFAAIPVAGCSVGYCHKCKDFICPDPNCKKAHGRLLIARGGEVRPGHSGPLVRRPSFHSDSTTSRKTSSTTD